MVTIDWSTVSDLGQLPDKEIAKRLGCSTCMVGIARRARGISPVAPPSPRVDWSTITDLGQVPDKEIAERLGCNPHTVCNARKRMGIPSTLKRRLKNQNDV